MSWVRERIWKGLAFAIGLAASAVTVAFLTSGSGFASQFTDRLVHGVARHSILSFLQQTLGAEAGWQFLARDVRRGSMAQWSTLGAPLSKVWTDAYQAHLDVKGPARGPLATMVRLPVEINNADRLDRRAVLLVTNVPENSALSAGRPLGAGAWVVPLHAVRDLAIISYAQPSRRPLSLDLMTPDGKILSSAEVLMEII